MLVVCGVFVEWKDTLGCMICFGAKRWVEMGRE
jgi:hypothetical protein